MPFSAPPRRVCPTRPPRTASDGGHPPAVRFELSSTECAPTPTKVRPDPSPDAGGLWGQLEGRVRPPLLAGFAGSEKESWRAPLGRWTVDVSKATGTARLGAYPRRFGTGLFRFPLTRGSDEAACASATLAFLQEHSARFACVLDGRRGGRPPMLNMRSPGETGGAHRLERRRSMQRESSAHRGGSGW